MFLVRRKIFPSYRLTSSSKAVASPPRAAATRRCSSSRTIVDGRRCGLGVLKVPNKPPNGAPKPSSAVSIAFNIRTPIPHPSFDEGERGRDSEIYGNAAPRPSASFHARKTDGKSLIVCTLEAVPLADSCSPGSQDFSHGPSLGDASTGREWCVSVEDLAKCPDAVRSDLFS